MPKNAKKKKTFDLILSDLIHWRLLNSITIKSTVTFTGKTKKNRTIVSVISDVCFSYFNKSKSLLWKGPVSVYRAITEMFYWDLTQSQMTRMKMALFCHDKCLWMSMYFLHRHRYKLQEFFTYWQNINYFLHKWNDTVGRRSAFWVPRLIRAKTIPPNKY